MMRSTNRIAAFLLVAGLVGAACGGNGADSDAQLSVLATTTMLGDVASNIAGDDAVVETLLPIGTDPHDFQASARQVAAIVEADLVIANGLGLEDGLLDVLEGAVADGVNVFEIAELLDPIPFGEAGGDGGSSDRDPHVWLDPLRMATAAELIAAELARLDDTIDWAARARAYATELRDADAQIVSILDAVPSENRKLVTNHDALGYFAQRYGFDILGTVIPGGSTAAAPSSAELAQLVGVIEAADVDAIFVETTEPAALAEAVAAEVDGGRSILVVELYTGSLGEAGSGAETLIEMLTLNARRIAESLR